MEREHSWPHALTPSISPPRATTQKVLLIVVSAPERRMQNGNPAMVARIRGGAQLRRGVAHHIGGAGSAHKGWCRAHRSAWVSGQSPQSGVPDERILCHPHWAVTDR